jgi:hypothetical protein
MNLTYKHLFHNAGIFNTPQNLATWDRRLYFPSEGTRAPDFIVLKIHRSSAGMNPRTFGIGLLASTITTRPRRTMRFILTPWPGRWLWWCSMHLWNVGLLLECMVTYSRRQQSSFWPPWEPNSTSQENYTPQCSMPSAMFCPGRHFY